MVVCDAWRKKFGFNLISFSFLYNIYLLGGLLGSFDGDKIVTVLYLLVVS